ncbi:hypothetical protein AMTRI_Chr11g94920 [Amborella trichopoda]
MGRSAILLVLLMVCLVPCYGSRITQTFSSKPTKPENFRYYFNFFPKAMPIPPSGPSKRHNGLGLQKRGFP